MFPSSVTRRPHLRQPTYFWITLLLWALAAGAPLGRAAADANSNLVFILDASGSMGALVQGKAKMGIAKDVLAHLIGDLPVGVKVGLVAYGHRSKRDCNDVETLAAPAPVDKRALIAKIKALDHQGMTPITETVRQVAEGLRGLEEATTIVLVSDGEETCGGDPCALVKELKASGMQFVLHVIGFAVTDKERVQLACMADAGNGAYFTAKNAQELSAATKRVVAPTEASAGGLRIKAVRNGKPIGAWYEVFAVGAAPGEGQLPLAANPIGLEGETIKLTPGVYDLLVKNIEDVGTPVVSVTGIAIVAGKTVERVADFSGGNLKVKALRNGAPSSGWYEVFTAGTRETVDRQPLVANPLGEDGETIKLLPGVYDLRIRNMDDVGNPVVDFAGIRLDAGQSVEKVADFSGGTLEIRALRNGEPSVAWYAVFKSGETEANGDVPIASNPVGESGEAVKLPPGVYDLALSDQNIVGSPVVRFIGIAIQPGKTVAQVAAFTAGSLRIKANDRGRPVAGWYSIYPSRQGEAASTEAVASNPFGEDGETVRLPTGVYRMEVRYTRGSAAEAVAEFQGIAIEAGQVVERIGSF